MILRRGFPLFFVLIFVLSVQSVNANTPLRVLSWNIQFGQGTDGVTNFDRIAAWLARMNPDVIALCEMPPDKIPTLITSLTQRSGRAWFTHFVPKAPGINEGNLIISAYSLNATSSKYLSYTRSIAQVTINVGGRNINFFATHLDHTSSALRQTEAQELLSWTSGFAGPKIVAGDMNAANDTPEVISMLNVYRDSWVDALNQGAALAYPDNPVWLNTRTRRWRIDFILYSSDQTVFAARGSNIPDTRDLSNTNVVTMLGTSDDKGVRPSDHNLVVADFEVAGAVATPTPTPAPAPVLLTQGSTDRALAIHSTQFTHEPFTIRSEVNLSSDHRTRIMLFAVSLDFLASSVSVRATDSRGLAYDLAVEQVTKVPNFPWLSCVIVRLPDDQSIVGDLLVSLAMQSSVSNSVRVAIRAP